MELVADLHIHSKYSRAVSPQMVIPEIAKWAAKKGIGLAGTGDWTHPLWLKELQANLEETAPGIYKTKSRATHLPGAPQAPHHLEGGSISEVCFLLSTEISSIYSQGGKGRRVHNIILAPSFETVEKINEALKKRGANLLSDGRPIIGLSAKDLVQLVLEVDEKCLVIPAHAWTPWFSLYGSKSGFDSINECFGEMGKYIYGIETGLSSDPGMNWRIAELDNRSIVSFSDAHSLQKLGREATVFEIKDKKIWGYEDIREAIIGMGKGEAASKGEVNGLSKRDKKPNQTTKLAASPDNLTQARIAYTIEFYPEEGKYHFTGHRNCKVKQNPEETKRLGETCPVCGKHLTVGVMHRVEELAGREVKSQKSTLNQSLRLGTGQEVKSDGFGVKWIMDEGKPPYVMLVPLMEILAEALGTLVGSQKVLNEFEKLTEKIGSEFEVLLRTPVEEIAQVSGPKVAEGVQTVRAGDIVIDPGYDGVFGTVKIWPSFAPPKKESSIRRASEGKPGLKDVAKNVNENGGQISMF